MSAKAADTKTAARKGRVLADMVDRLPPHSPEAEQGVLGCILSDPAGCMDRCLERLREGGDAFYDLRHQTIYEAAAELWVERKALDLITLQQWLKDHHMLDEVGGAAYLGILPDVVPSAANLPFYLDILEEKHLLRRMVRVLTESVPHIYEANGDWQEVLDGVERDVMAVRALRAAPERRTHKSVLDAALKRMEDAVAGVPVAGLPTGLADFDRITGGLYDGEMTVLAGRPSQGKSSLAMNIADHVAVELGKPVGVFSLEMPAEMLVNRMLCARARVSLSAVRKGELSEDEMKRLGAAAGRMSKARIEWEDGSDATILEVRAKARRMAREAGVRFIVADYLQLVAGGPGGRKDENKEQEVNRVALGFKNMARELGVPVLVLSQLNDDGLLRDSRAIGHHADGVLRLKWRGAAAGEGKRGKGKTEAEEEALGQEVVPTDLLLLKQRNGGNGVVHLVFIRPYTKFECAARTEEPGA